MANELEFRDAHPSEDDELARVLYNAFLPIWNHNWFQCLEQPLEPIRSLGEPLTTLQKRRLAFYRAWFAFNRRHHGDITVACTPGAPGCALDSNGAATGHGAANGHGAAAVGGTSRPGSRHSAASTSFASARSGASASAGAGPEIAAVCMLLPPYARPSFGRLDVAYQTGLLQSLLGLGPRGFARVALTFEGNIERMISAALKRMGLAAGREQALTQVQGCVRNPEWKGHRPARRLLDWAIRRRWARERAGERWRYGGNGKNGHGAEGGGTPTPVWLDTSIPEGVRAYEAIGFRTVGECMVATGADKHGIKLRPDASAKEREEGRDVAKQSVMVRLPSESEEHAN